MRINKFLSEAGLCSRRAADREIASGMVTINGRVASLGDEATDADTVTFHGRVVTRQKEKVILAFYKPVGLVVTEDKREPKSLSKFLDYPRRVTYLGRLDKDSEGLLLLSDDGDLSEALMRGSYAHEKEYEVTIDREVTAEFLRKMEAGVYLPALKQTTRPCKARKLSKYKFSLILTQGLNRQIRRMCEELGVRVKRLKRVRVENILLGDLKPGEYRELTVAEEAALRARL